MVQEACEVCRIQSIYHYALLQIGRKKVKNTIKKEGIDESYVYDIHIISIYILFHCEDGSASSFRSLLRRTAWITPEMNDDDGINSFNLS